MKNYTHILSLLLHLLFVLLPQIASAQDDRCQVMQVENNRVSVPVSIAGNDYRAMLSTSNIGSTMTDSLAEELGLTVRTNPRRRLVTGLGKGKPYTYVRNVDLNFLGSNMPARRMAVVEGNDLEVTFSLRLFDNFIIQLDFADSKLCFYPRDAVDLQEFENVEIDSDPVTGNPVVHVSINGYVETWLELSLGYSGGILVDGSTASLIGLYEEENAASGNIENALSSVVDDLAFGPYKLENVSVDYPKPGVIDNIATREPIKTGTRISRNKGSNGRLGVDILKNFVVTLDFERERMHVVAK